MNASLEQLRFTIPEILSLIGLVQCVYILVYMAFRAGGWKNAFVPFLYFFCLGLAFLAGFGMRFLGGVINHYDLVVWALWSMGPPLSVLLMIQIARITQPPSLRQFWVLGLVPGAYLMALFMAGFSGQCSDTGNNCIPFYEWLILTGFLGGVISLLAMWSQRPLLNKLSVQPAGRDRYWLVLALVIVNLFFLGTMLLSLTPVLDQADIVIMRRIWGLGFVYLAGTSLFRIYPQAIYLIERGSKASPPSEDDHKIAERIKDLLTLQKVYQEPSYNRVNLAQELGVSETIISRVINQHFGKTLPQLFNELRLEDAKTLLKETDAPIKTIAEEVGFNSIASFNRVFKDSERISAGQYREDHKKTL